jgi:membrane protein DedA with SNARE-associated domain
LPTDLAEFLELIRRNGDVAYSLILGYAAGHALLIALFAGYAAAAGALNFGTLILVCWFGTFAGDVIRFWLGRRYGARLFGTFPRLERLVWTVARLTETHSVWLILFHRYPYVIRGAAAFAYGMSKLSWSRFLVLNFLAAGLWACGLVSLGYAFGQVSEKIMSDASSGLGLAMLVLFLGGAWLFSRKLQRMVVRD